MATRRKASELAEVNAALDAIANELAEANKGKDCPPYTVGFGGELHKRYIEWRREHPDGADEEIRTHREVLLWDVAKKPQISKKRAEGQGILAFYDSDGHLPIDMSGGRVPFPETTIQQWDAWWSVQEEEFLIQETAQQAKQRIYREVRSHFKNPTDTVERIMREVFHWTGDLNDLNKAVREIAAQPEATRDP